MVRGPCGLHEAPNSAEKKPPIYRQKSHPKTAPEVESIAHPIPALQDTSLYGHDSGGPLSSILFAAHERIQPDY